MTRTRSAYHRTARAGTGDAVRWLTKGRCGGQHRAANVAQHEVALDAKVIDRLTAEPDAKRLGPPVDGDWDRTWRVEDAIRRDLADADLF